MQPPRYEKRMHPYFGTAKSILPALVVVDGKKIVRFDMGKGVLYIDSDPNELEALRKEMRDRLSGEPVYIIVEMPLSRRRYPFPIFDIQPLNDDPEHYIHFRPKREERA